MNMFRGVKNLIAAIAFVAICLVGMARPAMAQYYYIGFSAYGDSGSPGEYTTVSGNTHHWVDHVKFDLNFVADTGWVAHTSPNGYNTMTMYQKLVVDHAYYWWGGGWDTSHVWGSGYYDCTQTSASGTNVGILTAPTLTIGVDGSSDFTDQYDIVDPIEQILAATLSYAENAVLFDYHYEIDFSLYEVGPTPGWQDSSWASYHYSVHSYRDTSGSW